MRHLLAPLAALCLLATTAWTQGQTWFVSNGLEFGHHDTVQAAVDAAGDGDLIVVRPGHYDAFAIDNKSLTIAAELPESVWIESTGGSAIKVENIPASGAVELSDLLILQLAADPVGTVFLHDNEGRVQLERIIVGSLKEHPVQQSLRIVSCQDVEIVGSGFAQGVLARLSNVRFFESRIQGAEGSSCIGTPPAKPGGPGLEVLSGQVLLADTFVQGGRGGAGSNPLNCCNGSGGTGLLLGADAPLVTLRGGSVQGGWPGFDMGCAAIGAPIDIQSGSLLQEAGATPSGGFASEFAHSGGMSAIVARGELGQGVLMGFSFGAAVTPTPIATGDLLLALPLLTMVLFGPANGAVAGIESPVPFLPPGTAPVELFAQTLANDPVDGPVLGHRDRVLIVDMASALAGMADCDGDGITDAYAIWSGLAHDDDQNGVPDACDAPVVLHVDDDAAGDPLADGSAAHPFGNLADAVAAAPLTFTVIELAAGTYTGPQNRDLTLSDRTLLVRGAGAGATVVDLQQQGRLFRIDLGSRVTLADLAVHNGKLEDASGGALYVIQAGLRMRGMQLENNQAKAGGAIYSYGSDIAAKDTLLRDNVAAEDGGALYEVAPISTPGGTIGVRLERCELIGNSAGAEGGALYCASKTVGPRVTSSRFVENFAGQSGGAVLMFSSTAVFESCLFAKNTAGLWGGALFSQTITFPFYRKPLTLRQSTVRDNHAGIMGGGLRVYGANILGSVLWGNTNDSPSLPAEIAPFGSNSNQGVFEGAYLTPEFVIRDSTLEFGVVAIAGTGSLEIVAGPGIDSLDPLFASASGAALAPGSPAIDHGGGTWVPPLGATDVDGDPRMYGPRIDRGADEFKP